MRGEQRPRNGDGRSSRGHGILHARSSSMSTGTRSIQATSARTAACG